MKIDKTQFVDIISTIINNNITSLDVYSNQIKEIPQEIEKLKKMQHLNLSRNQLTEIPAKIDQLTNLQHLDLRYNRITKISAEIGKMVNLEELYLGGNPDLNIIDGSITVPFDIVNITPPPNLKHISVPIHRSDPNDKHYVENQEFISKISPNCEIEYK